MTQILIITNAQLSHKVKWNSKTDALHLLIERMPKSNRIKQLVWETVTLVQYLLLFCQYQDEFCSRGEYTSEYILVILEGVHRDGQHWTVSYRTMNITFSRIWKLEVQCFLLFAAHRNVFVLLWNILMWMTRRPYWYPVGVSDEFWCVFLSSLHLHVVFLDLSLIRSSIAQ
jgi:hypothetical protein